METAGRADATWNKEKQCLGVRGICDYCDLNKNEVGNRMQQWPQPPSFVRSWNPCPRNVQLVLVQIRQHNRPHHNPNNALCRVGNADRGCI
jgi:hypothetical protein